MINRQDSRHRIKRSNLTGVTPTAHTASTDFTDGTWLNTDIREGEFFYNIPDVKLWIGTGTSSKEITFGAESLADTLAVGNIVPTDQTIRGASNSFISMGGTTYETVIELVSGDNLSGTATWSSVNIDSVSGLGLVMSNDTLAQFSQISILPTYVNLTSSDSSNTSITELSPNSNKTTLNNVIKVERGAKTSTSALGIYPFIKIFGGVDILDGQMASCKLVVSGYDITNNKTWGGKFFCVFERNGGVVSQIGTTDLVAKENFGDGTRGSMGTDGTDIILSLVQNNGLPLIEWSVMYEYIITP